jgi:putative ABC transport system ATP-binding protein
MSSPVQAILEIRSLSKTYNTGKLSVPVLYDINLKINKGEFVSIMGPSGCGKSTLMNLIGCLDRPTGGSVRLNGTDVSSLSDAGLAGIRNKNIGFVFQTFNLLPRITSEENVEMPLIYSGISVQERRKKSRSALESMGVLKRADHRPNEISGGERQRVAIARAIVNGPAVILADEPTGNLDSKSGLEVMKIFEQLNRSGVTILMVTHDRSIASWGNRLVSMLDGRIIEDSEIKKS